MIQNLVACPKTELILACDLDEERLEKVLSPYPGVWMTTDLKDILADDGTDAIAIATTPVYSHFSTAKASLESGKHVLIEKPLAFQLGESSHLSSKSAHDGIQ